MHWLIRAERPEDYQQIDEVHRAAFGTEVETKLVQRLRENGKAVISLVAEHTGTITGHVLLSPVSILGTNLTRPGLGLAPVAVLPQWQRQGIGTRLVEAGIAACRDAGCGFIVVLGHPEFYRRFGFERASLRGLGNEYGVDEPFMALELFAGSLPPQGGLVQYAPEFAGLA